MGWFAIFDENNNQNGVVGDEPFDIAGPILNKLLKELNKLYQQEVGRKITEAEFEAIIDFVRPLEEDFK